MAAVGRQAVRSALVDGDTILSSLVVTGWTLQTIVVLERSHAQVILEAQRVSSSALEWIC